MGESSVIIIQPGKLIYQPSLYNHSQQHSIAHTVVNLGLSAMGEENNCIPSNHAHSHSK